MIKALWARRVTGTELELEYGVEEQASEERRKESDRMGSFCCGPDSGSVTRPCGRERWTVGGRWVDGGHGPCVRLTSFQCSPVKREAGSTTTTYVIRIHQLTRQIR